MNLDGVTLESCQIPKCASSFDCNLFKLFDCSHASSGIQYGWMAGFWKDLWKDLQPLFRHGVTAFVFEACLYGFGEGIIQMEQRHPTQVELLRKLEYADSLAMWIVFGLILLHFVTTIGSNTVIGCLDDIETVLRKFVLFITRQTSF